MVEEMPAPAITAQVPEIRLAILGDAEPKPNPVFPNLEKAIIAINSCNARLPLDFVIGIGDMAYKGGAEQYEAATQIIDRLTVPLYAIMGNEEMEGGAERFLTYAARWQQVQPGEVPHLRFTRSIGCYAFIFVSAEVNGVEFSEDDLHWLQREIDSHADKFVVLMTHAPAPDIFPQAGRRAISNRAFLAFLQRPNVRLHISGHTHINLDCAVTYSQDAYGVHHLHVPGLERTKIGAPHVPRIRFITMKMNGEVDIQTYNLDENCCEDRHRVHFHLAKP